MTPAVFIAGFAALLTGPRGETAVEVAQANTPMDAGSVDVGGVDAGIPSAPDAGIFALCVEPPPDDHAVMLPSGYWLLSPVRASYDACRIGAGEQCNRYLADPPNSSSPQDSFQLQVSHGIIAVVTAMVAAEVAVIKSRADQGCKAVANPFATTCH